MIERTAIANTAAIPADIGQDRETRLRFMRIDAGTSALLREFWKSVEPALPDILDGFYQHISKEPCLAGMLGNNIVRLKSAQASHWRRLLDGNFDSDYIKSARTIGLVHNKIGLEPRWYIGGYNFILSALTDLAIEKYRWRRRHLANMITAVNAAVMLDMDIAISVYEDAMLAEREQRQGKLTTAIEEFDGRMAVTLKIVSGAAARLQTAANALATSANESTGQSRIVAAASEDASTNVQMVAAATEELTASVREICRQVAESARMTHNAVDQANRSSVTMQSLSEAARKVGDVVKLINLVAEQTNLLALNATIEAARAGEAGKGFAVVAQEVKALASQTAKATDEISSQIFAIQEAAKDSVTAINAIVTTIGSVNEIAAMIAAATEEQGTATASIAQNIQDAARGTNEVSTKIGSISRLAVETGETAAQLSSAADELTMESEALRSQVEKFFADIRTT